MRAVERKRKLRKRKRNPTKKARIAERQRQKQFKNNPNRVVVGQSKRVERIREWFKNFYKVA